MAKDRDLSLLSFSEEDSQLITTVLEKWTNHALESRTRQENEWREDLRTYNANPRLKEKNFPWRGASNLVIPMKAIVADSIVARLHSAVFDQAKIWKATFEDPDAADDQGLFEDVLDNEARNRMRFEYHSSLVESDSVLFGTGFGKGMWLDERRVVKVPQLDGSVSFQEIFDYYGPAYRHRPIEDILVPPDTVEINGPERCQFITDINTLRWDQLKDREKRGYDIAALEAKITGKPDNTPGDESASAALKELREKLRGIENTHREGFIIHETWCYFPVHLLSKFPDRTVKIGNTTHKREYVELVITWHPKTKTILRCLENWNEIGWRPFFALPYIRRSSSIYGIGVGRAIHNLNEALDNVHNQRIDNATIANTRIWKARKSAFPRGTTISPSKIIWMNDPADLQPEAAGEVYPSSEHNELIIRGYIELRTGINDYNLGREDPTGRYSATATSTKLLLQEGTRKFDFIIRDWKQVYGQIATWLVSQYKQYGYHYRDFLIQQLGPEKAVRFMLALNAQSTQPTFATYKFTLEVAGIGDTKQARLENDMALLQVTEQVYGQIITLAGNITRGTDERGVPFTDAQKVVAWDAIEAGLTLYNRILETFDIKDTSNYTISKGTLQEALLVGAEQAATQAAQNALLTGGGPGVPGAAGQLPQGGPIPQAPQGGGGPPQQNSGRSRASA